MTLIRSNSLFPGFFDDFFTRNLNNWELLNRSDSSTLPSVNIVETADNFQVEMAIPGMKKEDFVVELDNEILKITGQVSHEEKVNTDDKFIRREFNYRSFERTFHLPKTVIDQSKINAKYDDGILKLTIPKKEEAKALPPRRIAIG